MRKILSRARSYVNSKYDFFCRVYENLSKKRVNSSLCLPKKVSFGGHEKVFSGAGGMGVVGVVADGGDGDAARLAHNEFGCGCEFVGDDGGGQGVAVGVGLAAVVGQRVHAGDADGDVGDAVPPGASERGGDDDGEEVGAQGGGELVADAGGGGVGVEGQEADHVFAGDVGGVHAGVRADKAVAGLGDYDAALHPDDAFALAQHDLDLARVLVVAAGEVLGEDGGLDGVQVHEASLGLADDLVRHHHHVAGPQQAGGMVRDHGRQVVAGPHLGYAGDWQHPHP